MGDMSMAKYREVLVMSGDAPVYQDLSNHHRGQDYRRGHQRQMFAVHDPDAGISYRASYSTTPPGPSSPRHHHNFEQIRFILDGEWQYGKNKRYGPGWLGFFAEGVFYGPQQNLKDNRGFVIQYPGPSGAKFISREEEKRLQKEMVEKGCKFESGLCTWLDGKRQDGSEALWEYFSGERLKYPKPLFDDQVWLDTALFAWRPTGVPGVSIKRLAYFSERGPAIALLKLEPGSSTPPGETGCMMMRFIYEGEAEYAGKRCPSVSSLYYPPDARYDALHSATGCTVLSIELQLAGEESPLPYRV
jgi:hypothetical protein